MEIHIGNRVADVTLVSKEGNKVRLSIDGKPYDVDIVMTENGSCSVLHDGNSCNAAILSPIASIVSADGPININPSCLQRRAKSAFSDKKP